MLLFVDSQIFPVIHSRWYIRMSKISVCRTNIYNLQKWYLCWRHLVIGVMCQPEAHWFLEQKILLFHLLQIWITKTMHVISDVSHQTDLKLRSNYQVLSIDRLTLTVWLHWIWELFWNYSSLQMKVTGEMITLMRTKVCQTRHKREDFMKIMALILVSSKSQSISKLFGRKYNANNRHRHHHPCHHLYYLYHHHHH